jgi:uncharacterized protein (UPF0218 family)
MILSGFQMECPMSEQRISPEDRQEQYRDLFNTTIGEVISHAIRIIGADPSLIIPAGKILRYQKKTAKIRAKHEKEGLQVPPVMIISITTRCNLTLKAATCMPEMRIQNGNETGYPHISH